MKIILCLLLLCSAVANSQEDNFKFSDTATVIYKAKLLTIERQGSLNAETLDQFLNDFKVSHYIIENFMFIVIQPPTYIFDNHHGKTALWGDCKYYLGYDSKSNTFYRLGGFECENINEFHKILKKSTARIKFESIITDKKLLDFLSALTAGKQRKAKKMFAVCSRELATTITIY